MDKKECWLCHRKQEEILAEYKSAEYAPILGTSQDKLDEIDVFTEIENGKLICLKCLAVITTLQSIERSARNVWMNLLFKEKECERECVE